MADVLYEALKPMLMSGGLSAGLQKELGLNDYGFNNWVNIARRQGNQIAFNAAAALGLMDAYNTTYNLGLTHDEIAKGITRFRAWTANRFGSDQLDATSSVAAVAAQSLVEAMVAKGQDGWGSAFWQDMAKPGGELQKSNDAAMSSGLAAYENVTKTFNTWVFFAGAGFADGQEHTYGGGGGFGDLLMAVAPIAMAAIVGPAIMAEFGGAALAGEAASLAAADAAAGLIPATEFGGVFAGEAASLAAADAAAGLIPANTGGMFVGTEGLLGGTGNAIADSALNGAVQSGITSAVTGRDPVQGALSGAAGGLLGTAGLGQQVASGVGATGDAGAAITSGVNAAASTAASTAIAGGSFSDILENSLTSGITQGAGSYVSNVLDSGSTAIDRGVGGAVTGGLNAAITGGDVGAGLLTSGLSGAAGGAATDAGYGPEVAGVAQNVTGGLLNSALQEETAIQVPAPTTTTPAPSGGLSFSDIVPQFKDVTRSTEWGDRLLSAGRI